MQNIAETGLPARMPLNLAIILYDDFTANDLIANNIL